MHRLHLLSLLLCRYDGSILRSILHRRLPLFLFATGVAYTLYLQTLTQPGAFYSCDGGLKFLWTRQFARDGVRPLHLELDKAAPAWVQQLWQTGLFPFDPPFVYPRENRQYVNYQPFFCMVSTPFYAALGWRGLYLLPLVSMWLLWLVFLCACRRQGLGVGITAAAMAVLIFAAPLTLYSAMFWEHVPALLLAMLGLLALDHAGATDSVGRGVRYGLPLGFSAFMRPELLMTGVAAAALVWLFRELPWGRRTRLGFTLTLAAALAAWMGWNLAVSGAPLGFHGRQIPTGLAQRLTGALPVIGQWLVLLGRTFPLAIVAVLLIAAARVHPIVRSALTAADRLRLLLCLLLTVALPLIFPNDGGKQWGPRYLLLLVPILTLVSARLVQAILAHSGRPARIIAGGLFVAAALWGAYENTLLGTRDLASDYATRILPAARLIHAAPTRFIVTHSPFVSMELTDTFADHWWFLTPNAEAMSRLVRAMHDHGERRLWLVGVGLPRDPPPIHVDGPGGPLRLRFVARAQAAAIDILQAEIVDEP